MYMAWILKGVCNLRTPYFELFVEVLPKSVKPTDIKTKIDFTVSLRKQLVSQDESLDVLEIVSPLSEREATCRSEFFLSVIFFKRIGFRISKRY